QDGIVPFEVEVGVGARVDHQVSRFRRAVIRDGYRQHGQVFPARLRAHQAVSVSIREKGGFHLADRVDLHALEGTDVLVVLDAVPGLIVPFDYGRIHHLYQKQLVLGVNGSVAFSRIFKVDVEDGFRSGVGTLREGRGFSQRGDPDGQG